MTITLSPEQERLLTEAVEAGLAQSPDEALDKAVRALRESAPSSPQSGAKNLSDLLLNSPFAGANLNLDRAADYPRAVDLE